MNELVSVIVPIYNSEKYIKKCIESIVTQTYPFIEILLINDGSTDNSLEIIKSFEDNRIVILNKFNTGVSETRNLGIHNAKGDYIIFVDSDDWLEKDYINYHLSTIKSSNCDIVITGYKKVCLNNVFYKILKEKTYNIETDIDNTKIIFDIINNFNGSSIWSKLYKKSIVNKIGMRKIRIGEDLLFNIEYLKHCKKVYIGSYCRL